MQSTDDLMKKKNKQTFIQLQIVNCSLITRASNENTAHLLSAQNVT